MQSQNQNPTFELDEKTRKEREEKGQILKHEDELQDISNMDLSKFKQNKTDQLMEKSKELRGKADEQISDFKSKIAEKSGNLKEGGTQKENSFAPKGQALKQKAQEYLNKASDKASEIKKDIKKETSSKHESKRTLEKTQAHHGEKSLTEQTKHDILELTEKLTEKIQALKQVDQKPQSKTASSSQVQTQDFEQSYSVPQQEKLESQPSDKNQETKFEHNKEEQPKFSPLEQKQLESNEKKQEQIQAQKPEEQHKERTPLVDQVLGRIHSASDNLHHKVDDFKNAFKVEEPTDTERVPFVDKLAHGIHDVTDKITGVFKHKAKPTKLEKDESYRYRSSKSLPEKQPQGEISSRFQEQESIRKGGFGSDFIGSEFRENIEGFSKTMEDALQEESSKPVGGKEYRLDRFEQEQKCGLSADRDFRIQGTKEFRQEGPAERSELRATKQEEKPTFTQGSKDISTNTEDTSTWVSRGSSILRKIEEDIEIIDRLLERSTQKGSKLEYKGVDASSSPKFEKLQGFGKLSNQSAEIGINAKDDGSLTRQVYQDVNASDKLVEGAILGEKNAPRESYESSATNLYNKSSKPRTEIFRDITNEAAGSLSQKAEKDLNKNDKLLDKSIREGKTDFGAEPEDKENIGKKGPSMSGANISHCDGMRELVQTL